VNRPQQKILAIALEHGFGSAADGAPRLHPVCPVLSNERLFVLITPEFCSS